MLAKMMIRMMITTITIYTITCTCQLQVQFSIVKRLPYKKLWLPWHLFTITLNAKLTVMVKCYTQYWKIQNEVYLNEINLTWSLFILGLCLCGSLMEVFKLPIGDLCRNINCQIYSSLAMATKTVTTCSAELLRGALANYKKWWCIYLCFKTYNRFLFFGKTKKPF